MYETQRAISEEARVQRNKQRQVVEAWMDEYFQKYGLRPGLRETGKAFGKSGTWVMLLLRMKEQDGAQKQRYKKEGK